MTKNQIESHVAVAEQLVTAMSRIAELEKKLSAEVRDFNAAFIAACPTGWLAALDRIDELEAENRRLLSSAVFNAD